MFLGCGWGEFGGALFLESIIEAMTASMILSPPTSNNITEVISAWKFLLSQHNCVNKLIYQKHTREGTATLHMIFLCTRLIQRQKISINGGRLLCHIF